MRRLVLGILVAVGSCLASTPAGAGPLALSCTSLAVSADVTDSPAQSDAELGCATDGHATVFWDNGTTQASVDALTTFDSNGFVDAHEIVISGENLSFGAFSWTGSVVQFSLPGSLGPTATVRIVSSFTSSGSPDTLWQTLEITDGITTTPVAIIGTTDLVLATGTTYDVDGQFGMEATAAGTYTLNLSVDLFLVECSDGLDNDGDGLTDLIDPGCIDTSDLDERDPLLPCDDGADNDGDGRTDFDPVTAADPAFQAGSDDPGCFNSLWALENPACNDGANNDSTFGTDFDGGASVPPGVVDPNGADPQCVGDPWGNSEGGRGSGPCGLGIELALLLAPLMWLRGRRRRVRGRRSARA